MGFGTVFAMLSFLLVFAGMIGVVTGIQQTFADTTQEVAAHQAMLAAADDEEISITATGYASSATVDWTVTYADEFSEGTHDNTSLSGDSVVLDQPTGTYTSSAYDTGFASNFTTLSWSSVSTGGSVSFQVRTADDEASLLAAPFLGPDATAGTYYTVPGTSLPAATDDERYVQWRAYLSGAGQITLHDVTLGVRRGVGHATLSVENTGSRKLSPEETDLYLDGVRVLRSESARSLSLEQLLNPRLWDPGETLTVTVFTTIPVSQTITVSNGFAKDQSAVTP